MIHLDHILWRLKQLLVNPKRAIVGWRIHFGPFNKCSDVAIIISSKLSRADDAQLAIRRIADGKVLGSGYGVQL